MLRRKLPITRAAALVRRFSAAPAQDLSPATTAVRKGHELDLSKVMSDFDGQLTRLLGFLGAEWQDSLAEVQPSPSSQA